jgi:hypothetical protein
MKPMNDDTTKKRLIPNVPPSERQKLYLGHDVVNKQTLYSEIEHLIIRWNNDGTKTAGSLTRDIMKLFGEKINF